MRVVDSRPTSATLARLALCGLAAASLAACASRPKPTPVAANTAGIGFDGSAPSSGYTAGAPRETVEGGYDSGASASTPGSTQDFMVNVGDRVFFDYDQSDVRADARGLLDRQAAWLARYPQVNVRVEGNTDERGTREYNLALGSRRASAVRDYLAARGVYAGRMETVSYGKERPIETGADESGYARNRNARTVVTGGSR